MASRTIGPVDDETGVRESLRMVLKDAYDPMAVGSSNDFDLVVLGAGTGRLDV